MDKSCEKVISKIGTKIEKSSNHSQSKCVFPRYTLDWHSFQNHEILTPKVRFEQNHITFCRDYILSGAVTGAT